MEHQPLARRSFLSRLGTGLTVLGAALTGDAAKAQAQSVAGTKWQPSRHAQDDWLDQVPGKHRFLLDTTTADGLGEALLYTNNYFLANQNAYGLSNTDLAVVIVVRHFSTPFAYNDAIDHWDSAAAYQDPTNIQNLNGHEYAPESGGSGLDSVFTNAKWLFKLNGMYSLPLGINAAGNIQFRQGYPFPQAIQITNRGNGLGNVNVLVDPMGSERLPNVTVMRFAKPTMAKPAPPEIQRAMLKDCDFVVEALAD